MGVRLCCPALRIRAPDRKFKRRALLRFPQIPTRSSTTTGSVPRRALHAAAFLRATSVLSLVVDIGRSAEMKPHVSQMDRSLPTPHGELSCRRAAA
ncbi:hypothetical protein BCV69DRAFT_211572 [Microstroma glucosiphilum]|uniref:Uncharacterized protein n=1 Tax=Pseudomicrostroma glucosiphilum TaxID=1684307 RepID=A0A316U5H8_9BASI|nr:hypothetical protein BCV69DRAFT_211572 [Pseudomicrostroma glucosiphilum]PWN20502.1 hypothetical protein BCV69DRAFT_211572 [Pseudomicrostroma glucosiphilum]